jgi:hypothetical protein
MHWQGDSSLANRKERNGQAAKACKIQCAGIINGQTAVTSGKRSPVSGGWGVGASHLKSGRKNAAAIINRAARVEKYSRGKKESPEENG